MDSTPIERTTSEKACGKTATLMNIHTPIVVLVQHKGSKMLRCIWYCVVLWDRVHGHANEQTSWKGNGLDIIVNCVKAKQSASRGDTTASSSTTNDLIKTSLHINSIRVPECAVPLSLSQSVSTEQQSHQWLCSWCDSQHLGLVFSGHACWKCSTHSPCLHALIFLL